MDAGLSPQRRLQRPVLWFVLTALLLLPVLIGGIAWKQGAFAKTTQLYFFAKTAYGMNKGMAVKFSGFRIGSVEDVSLEPNGSVKVRMVIDNAYIHFVPKDSKARLGKEGLIGASVIEIDPGESGARQAADNDVLAFARLRDFNDLAEELADQIQPILTDVKKITEFINDPDNDLRQTIKNINRTSAALVETTQEIKRLVQSSDQRVGVVSGQVGALLQNAGQRLDQVGASLKTLDEKMPALMLKADKTLENIQAVSANVKKITDEAAEQVPGMLNDGKAAAEDAREIVGGVKKAWPVRNFVKPQQETLIPLDSHESGSAQRR
jgi:phospholipid/cholesterol/gamma-HCH transport system substrate-binding protein